MIDHLEHVVPPEPGKSNPALQAEVVRLRAGMAALQVENHRLRALSNLKSGDWPTDAPV